MSVALIAFILGGLLLGGLGRFIEYAVRYYLDRNKSWVIWPDGDSGTARVEKRELRGNEIIFKETKKSEGKAYRVEGKARLLDNKTGTPVHIIHPRHGWNFTVPTDEDTVHSDALLRYLSVSNPEAYYYAIKHNDARDSLQANQEAENAWLVQIAPFALAGLLLILLGVGFLVYRFAGFGG